MLARASPGLWTGRFCLTVNRFILRFCVFEVIISILCDFRFPFGFRRLVVFDHHRSEVLFVILHPQKKEIELFFDFFAMPGSGARRASKRFLFHRRALSGRVPAQGGNVANVCHVGRRWCRMACGTD